MSRRPTEHYVVVGSDVERDGRIVPSVAVVPLPVMGEQHLVESLVTGVYAVSGVRRPRAVAAVLRWALTGRPSAMSVRVVYERQPLDSAALARSEAELWRTVAAVLLVHLDHAVDLPDDYGELLDDQPERDAVRELQREAGR